jgi:hypothetical protein
VDCGRRHCGIVDLYLGRRDRRPGPACAAAAAVRAEQRGRPPEASAHAGSSDPDVDGNRSNRAGRDALCERPGCASNRVDVPHSWRRASRRLGLEPGQQILVHLQDQRADKVAPAGAFPLRVQLRSATRIRRRATGLELSAIEQKTDPRIVSADQSVQWLGDGRRHLPRHGRRSHYQNPRRSSDHCVCYSPGCIRCVGVSHADLRRDRPPRREYRQTN